MIVDSENNILGGGVAVITGSAGGIGAGIARAAAARGMKLVLADIAVDKLNQFASELTAAGHQVLAVPTNVTDPAALDHLAAVTRETFGDVRLLVNNAGIETIGNAWELTAVQWERVMRINVLGPIHGVRAFAGAMVAAGAPAFISNVASLGALAIMPEQTPYIMSKHAVLSFSECLSLEMAFAAPNIRVSAALPGPVATRIFTDAQVGKGSPSLNQHRDTMDGMMAAHGMPPDEAGILILDQIAEGRFWVTTHPEMLADSARQRAAYLAKLDLPSMRAESLAVMGRG